MICRTLTTSARKSNKLLDVGGNNTLKLFSEILLSNNTWAT